MTHVTSWKLLERKTAYSSKFVSVYEDKVALPDETVIDDYMVVEKPSIVMEDIRYQLVRIPKLK